MDGTMDARAQAGPETDRLVAELFMGWHLEAPWRGSQDTRMERTHWHDRRGLYTGWATERCCGPAVGRALCEVFAPSAESRQAVDILIAEAVRRGLIHRIGGPGDPARPEMACDLLSAAGTPLGSGRGETMALAVCRAVLGLPHGGGTGC